MDDENPTSRKVHHGSLEREADESTRRRKHRHHRHHHHRSSRKHRDSDQNKKGPEEELRSPTVSLSKNVAVLEATSHQHDARADYDMEEGEIIEEDEVCNKTMTAHFRDGGDHDASPAKVKIGGTLFQNTESQSGDFVFCEESQVCDVDVQNDGSAVEMNIRQKYKIDITCKKYTYQGYDTSMKHHKTSSTHYGDGHVSCDTYDGVRKEHDVVVRIDNNCKITSESIYGGSPRPRDSVNSWPHRPSGERSRSTSILQESASLVYGDNGAVSTDSRQCMNGSSEEQTTKRREADGYRRKDVISKRESDHDGGCGAYCDHCDQKQSQVYWNRETEDRGAYEDQRRDRSHDRDRHLNSEKNEKPYKQRDRSWTRDQKMEGYNEREKQRNKSRADHYNRKLEKQPQQISDRSEDKNRKRQRERGGNIDDSRVEKHETMDRGTSRDKMFERERCRERDGERGRQIERYRDKTRVEYRSDVNIVYDGLNHSKYSSKSLRRGEIDKYGRRNSASDYRIENGSPYKRRCEVGSDEYGQGEVSELLPTEDQEEEDLNRIKEESKRRREAILEKYKAKLVKQRTIPQQQNDGKNAEIRAHEFLVEKSPHPNGTDDIQRPCGTSGLGEGTPKSEVPHMTDMFCDDIFGESPEEIHKSQRKGDGLPLERSGLHDNWDDAEGYYCYRFGELMDGRYEVTAAHGKGVFSTVVRARDLKAGYGDLDEVAIKIIRNNETMYKAGMQELVILKKLVGADPDNRRHCVRFVSHFKYRNHLCLVFESLHMNLRDVLKKFGRNIGLKLTAVRAYSKQLFIALKHLRNCGVLHCDIKPDNMVVNEAKNVLKLCDFGNAMFSGKNDLTPYLVSRFYRSPEIILGLPYDHPLDIWSIGCCIYEIYTGKVLFPGPTNNDMLRLHMELKGSFPKKMLRKGAFTDQHFDQDLNFHATEEDPVTKKTIKRLLLSVKPKDIGALISYSSVEDQKILTNFKDLLDKMFVLDPEKRITVSQALNHPFITALVVWWLPRAGDDAISGRCSSPGCSFGEVCLSY